MGVTRRTFLAASAGAASAVAQPRQCVVNRVTEWRFDSAKRYADPMSVNLQVQFTGPDGKVMRAPAFWGGEQSWRVRFAPPAAGRYTWKTFCSDEQNSDLHGVSSSLEAVPYGGSNALYRHGALQVAKDKRHLEHADGTPFFWLGDTWWMSLTDRLSWPEDFQFLTADRKSKGFSVVQLVAGLYPDMDSFDLRGRNEAGFPWTDNYSSIQPAWWDLADLRVQHLVESGLTPCIVGCWGYYLPKIGLERMKQHWRYIVARWGAYPVVWALAGEGAMPWYLSKRKDEERQDLVIGWTEVARTVREADAFHRIITVHPPTTARTCVTDPSVIDFDMLQTGHGDRGSLANTVKTVANSYAATPRMPVVNGEVCYEGILGKSPDEVVRLMFWASILNGACGFTYGADGIWQVNQEGKPYGPSPHGNTWGLRPWQEAAQLPGARQLGRCAALLRRYEWWRFEPHPEWVEPHYKPEDAEQPYAAGIPGRVRLVYVPTRFGPPALVGLETGSWRAAYVNPSTAERHELGVIQSNAGRWQAPTYPVVRDWLIVAERTS